MKLAGLKECGVCCEIMEDDGTMMRTPNLWKLAEKYNLKFITIKDLQDYIRIHPDAPEFYLDGIERIEDDVLLTYMKRR